MPLYRWISNTWPDDLRPDLTCYIGSDLRYEAIDVHRAVPTIIPPEQTVGRRLQDVINRELMYQVATAMQRSICLSAPVEIRYGMTLGGKLVTSRARVSTDSAAKMATVEIVRLLTCALPVVELFGSHLMDVI